VKGKKKEKRKNYITSDGPKLPHPAQHTFFFSSQRMATALSPVAAWKRRCTRACSSQSLICGPDVGLTHSAIGSHSSADPRVPLVIPVLRSPWGSEQNLKRSGPWGSDRVVATLVTGNWELGHVPRSGNVRSVPGTWEQSCSSSVKS
jgi:hypothetical protein